MHDENHHAIDNGELRMDNVKDRICYVYKILILNCQLSILNSARRMYE